MFYCANNQIVCLDNVRSVSMNYYLEEFHIYIEYFGTNEENHIRFPKCHKELCKQTFQEIFEKLEKKS